MKKNLFATLLATLSILLSSHAAQSHQYANDAIDSLNASRADEIAAHRLNRGIVQLDNTFAPRDQWVVGFTASYSTHINDNYSLTLIEGISSDGYTFNASPIIAYTFKDNMAAGVRFEYGRSRLRLDTAGVSVGDSFTLDIVDYYILQHNFTAMAILRQYIPLGVTKRFALFAETRLEFGGNRAKFAFDQPVVGTFSKGYSVGLGVVPGIVAFATNNVAFEITVGMLGVGYSYTEQIHNQVYVGEVESTNLSFKLNLLSIGLGVAFYF
ncbi:MAG: hypothetical protein R3Y68_03665 [Rikenellaceae bacterium]